MEHFADGRKCKRGHIDDEESYSPSALAGSIPVWDVQQPIYVHKEHFYWNPFSESGKWSGKWRIPRHSGWRGSSLLAGMQRLPAGVTATRSPKNDFTLDIQDVPAFVPEANAPPEQAPSLQRSLLLDA